MWPMLSMIFGAGVFALFLALSGHHLERPETTSARNLAQTVHILRSEAILDAWGQRLPSGSVLSRGSFQGAGIKQYIPAGRRYLATYVTGLDCASIPAHCGLAARLADLSDGTITLYLTSGTTLTSAKLVQKGATNYDETQLPALPNEVRGTPSRQTLVIYDRLQ